MFVILEGAVFQSQKHLLKILYPDEIESVPTHGHHSKHHNNAASIHEDKDFQRSLINILNQLLAVIEG